MEGCLRQTLIQSVLWWLSFLQTCKTLLFSVFHTHTNQPKHKPKPITIKIPKQLKHWLIVLDSIICTKFGWKSVFHKGITEICVYFAGSLVRGAGILRVTITEKWIWLNSIMGLFSEGSCIFQTEGIAIVYGIEEEIWRLDQKSSPAIGDFD